MNTRNRVIRNLITILFAMATALCLASEPGRGQEPAAEPKPQPHRYALSVTVVTTKESGEPESVKDATVTVFARDHQQAKRAADGKALFKFETEEKTVMIRVVADKMDPYQRTVELSRAEIEHKVVLTKSE